MTWHTIRVRTEAYAYIAHAVLGRPDIKGFSEEVKSAAADAVLSAVDPNERRDAADTLVEVEVVTYADDLPDDLFSYPAAELRRREEAGNGQ